MSSFMSVVLESRSSWLWEGVVGMVEDWVAGEVLGRKYRSQNLIGTMVIRDKKRNPMGEVSNKDVLESGGTTKEKKGLKVKGTTMIRMKI
jgi:hypothetical protein